MNGIQISKLSYMRPQPKPLLNIFPHMNIIALCFVVKLILIGQNKHLHHIIALCENYSKSPNVF